MKRRQPGPTEPRITTPGWALDRANEIARAIVAGIEASGVRVSGDLQTLVEGSRPAAASRAGKPADDITGDWAEVGATASMGVLVAAGLLRSRQTSRGDSDSWPDDLREPTRAHRPDLSAISTPRLLSVLSARLRSVAALRMGRSPGGRRA
jgi:hypothetical protein